MPGHPGMHDESPQAHQDCFGLWRRLMDCRVKRGNDREKRRSRHQCGSMPACLITSPQVFVSLWMKALACAGVVCAACSPILAKCSFASLLASTSWIALFNLSTMAVGVFGGALI